MSGLHVEQIDLTVFVGSALLVLGLMLHRMSVNRLEGSLLVVGYAAYVWYLYG
jgi:Ca2+/Na+ antiporter